MTKKSKIWQIVVPIAIIIVVVVGGFLFVGATAGWFSQSQEITLDAEYLGKNEASTLDPSAYEKMVNEKKSFIVIAYLPTCTADIIKYMKEYSAERDISYFYLNWSDLRQTSLKGTVDFSPSVILISKGRPIAHLRADSNEDTAKYNDFSIFSAWLDQYLAKNWQK